MKASFLLFANMGGIVCGSWSDLTIFQLSKKEPVALAVSPTSPIPWLNIIEKYRRKGEPQHHNKFELYAKDFNAYLSTVTANPEWRNLNPDKLRLIFMGYGTNDIYPTVYETYVGLNEESMTLQIEKETGNRITHKDKVYWSYIGNFNQMEIIFQGATTPMNQFIITNVQALYDEYVARVKAKFSGTKYEQMVDERIAKFDVHSQAQNLVMDASRKMHKRLQIGVDAFSIEDLVNVVETIINANIRLSHLQSSGKESMEQVREIAVITRAEGLTWIRHSLFAL